MSLRSGKGVLQALKSRGYNAEGFDVKPGASLLDLDWKNPPDIVYPALHGTFGEDGTLQGFLDALKIPYVGSGVLASAMSFHKGLTKRHLIAFGVPCPQSFDIQGKESLDIFLSKLPTDKNVFYKHKWFLKAARQGSTIGVERFDPSRESKPEESFRRIALEVMKYDDYLLIEEWIEGPELTVTVWNEKALPVVEIRPLSHFYDYESKYTVGKTEYLCPAPISELDTRKVQQAAEAAFRILECKDYARADFILGPQGPRFLEINTLPGMTETSLVPKAAKAAGLSYEDFVDQVVSASFKRQKGS